MSIRNGLFTSESVSEGHPDKLADRISDRILDAFLILDPDARVACETLLADQCVVVAGEFRTRRIEDFRAVREDVIGYDATHTPVRLIPAEEACKLFPEKEGGK